MKMKTKVTTKPKRLARLGVQAELRTELKCLERLQLSIMHEDVTLEEVIEQINVQINRRKVEIANSQGHLLPLRENLLSKLSIIDAELEYADTLTERQLNDL